MDAGDRQFEAFLTWLFTAAALPALAAFLAVLAAAVVFRPVRWVLLTLFLYACTFGSVSTKPWFDNTFVAPLEQIRHFGRPICTALLAAMLVPAMTAGRGWRSRLVLGAAVAFCCFEVVLSARLLLAGLVGRGVLGPILFLMTFGAIAVGVSSWIQDQRDLYTALRCVAVAGMLLAVGTLYQLALNRDAIIESGRLYGTTNNPNTLGYISALTIPVTAVLLMRRQEARWFRVVLFVALCVDVAFLLWSGSRAGFVTTAIATVLLFRRRLRRFWPVAVMGGVVLGAFFWYWSDISLARFGSFQDTRSNAWMSQIANFRQNPLIGTVDSEALVVEENLYLAVAATAGVAGLLPFAAAIFFIARSLVRLRRARAVLGDEAIVADLIVATFVATAVGSVFDAHLQGMLVFSVGTLYVYLAVASYLLEAAPYYAASMGQEALTYDDEAAGGYEPSSAGAAPWGELDPNYEVDAHDPGVTYGGRGGFQH